MSNSQQHWKLQPQLTPDSLRHRNVYRALRRNKLWRGIRENTKDSSGGKCEICKTPEGKMYCHEDWEYDDRTHVATLRRFMWICQDCNGAIHLGGGPVSWSGGLEDDPSIKIFKHMIKVNGMSAKEGFDLFDQTNQIHKKRSKHDWNIEIHPKLLERYPFLSDLRL